MKKTILALIFCGIYSLGGWATEYSPKTEAAIEHAIKEQIQMTRQETDAGLLPVLTTWNRCDVYTSRRSVPGFGGGRRKVKFDYNCQDVFTYCNAVLSEGKAYISRSCYYADKKDDQNLYFKSSRLKYTNGRIISLYPQQMSHVKEFIIFDLK